MGPINTPNTKTLRRYPTRFGMRIRQHRAIIRGHGMVLRSSPAGGAVGIGVHMRDNFDSLFFSRVRRSALDNNIRFHQRNISLETPWF